MFIQPVDLTSALRPALLPDEALLFVQNAIGLYQGQYKVPGQQNGQIYLTSHRICYVDLFEPRKYSIAVDLREVEKVEFSTSFLKASPKIILTPKASQRSTAGRINGLSSTASRSSTPSLLNSQYAAVPISSNTSTTPPRSGTPSATPATWVCPICSFPNVLPATFDASVASVHTPLPPCTTCGVKPPLALILKVAIANASGRSEDSIMPPSIQPDVVLPHNNKRDHAQPYYGTPGSASLEPRSECLSLQESTQTSEFLNQCPRCTFSNHASMPTCELCGTRLPQASQSQRHTDYDHLPRQDSPGPSLQDSKALDTNSTEPIKLSFRAGGSQAFYEKLRRALNQRKWLLHNAPPIPKSTYSATGTHSQSPEPRKQVGIASLERSRETQRKANELTLTTSFADLSALMASAKDILALAEFFATSTSESKSADALLQESASALGMVTTKNLLGSRSSLSSSGDAGSELYISELARSLAELLTDQTLPGGGILKREGGIMSTIDLWAVVNRSRGGLEAITPQDFEAATQMWDKLNLPVRLRKFKKGISVVQRRDWTDEKTMDMLLAWLSELHSEEALNQAQSSQSNYDQGYWGRGVSIHETAQHFGWSLGVAGEELEMAEEEGALCREETVEGLTYWENWIVWGDEEEEQSQWQGKADLEGLESDTQVIEENLRNVGIL